MLGYMRNTYLSLIEGLMVEVVERGAIEDCFSKIGVAALIEAREQYVFADFTGRGAPDPKRIRSADDAWLKAMLSHEDEAIRLRLALCLGIGAEGTPLEVSMKRLEVKADPDVLVSEMRYGFNEGMRRRMSFSEPLPSTDEADRRSIQSKINTCEDSLVDLLLKDALKGIDRKSYMRHINTLILLEEAALLCGAMGDFEEKPLRKLAMDYALMRLLSGLERLDGADIDGITSIMRITGQAARLNNPLSDALDRVQKYAAQAAKDPDMLDAARAAGRPLPQKVSDLLAVARQCRLFRDRERV